MSPLMHAALGMRYDVITKSVRQTKAPNTACTRPRGEHQGRDGGTAASQRARFQAVCVA